jgi:hypothetical protein
MERQTQSVTQSATRSIAAAHMTLVIRVYDEAGNVIETHEHKGDFKEAERESPRRCFTRRQRDVSEMSKNRKTKNGT